MLEAKGLHKTYRMGKVELPVLRDVTLTVEEGAFVAIIGPSGAGKSTLLHLLAGLDTPTSGTITWEGRDITRLSDAERARFRNHEIGVVFQFYHLLPELSALENVMLPGLVNGPRAARDLRRRAIASLEQVGLGQRLGHRPGELSGGEQQRAAIARALVNQPRMLFCDEPTGNLDSKTGEEITALLSEVHRRQRMSLVLVTHSAELTQLADATITLRDGRIESTTDGRNVRAGAKAR